MICPLCGGDLLAVCGCYDPNDEDSMNAWAHEVLYGEDERDMARSDWGVWFDPDEDWDECEAREEDSK